MRVRRPTSTRSRKDERLGCRSSSSQTAQDNQIHCYIYIQLALQFLFLLPGGGRSVLGVGKHRVEWASPKPSFQPQPNDRLQPSSLPLGMNLIERDGAGRWRGLALSIVVESISRLWKGAAPNKLRNDESRRVDKLPVKRLPSRCCSRGKRGAMYFASSSRYSFSCCRAKRALSTSKESRAFCISISRLQLSTSRCCRSSIRW